MAKISGETAKRVNGYVTKYMEMLKIDGKRPSLKLHDTPNADWGARLDKPFFIADDGSAGKGTDPAILNLQRMTLKADHDGENDGVLERVVAHEMVHLRDFYALTEDEAARIARNAADGVFAEEHGPSFFEGAERINAIMGPDFVKEREVLVLPSPQARRARAGASFSTKVMVAIGVGGIVGLGAKWLRRRQAQMPPPLSKQPAIKNERGSYGKSPAPIPMQPTRKNERGSYGKK